MKFDIPECMPSIWRWTFTVNLHAPGSGRSTTHKSLAGAFGIPDICRLSGGGLLK